MRLYNEWGPPNPDVVRMFLVESGTEDRLDHVRVGIDKEGDGRSAEGLKRNPLGEVPVLETDQGQFLSESISICEYLDSLWGGTPLLGMTVWDRAETSMWVRRLEYKVVDWMAYAFMNGPAVKFFDRRRPGTTIRSEQALEGFRRNARLGLEFVESQLQDGRAFLCGSRFSLADIKLYVHFAFFTRKDPSQKQIGDGLPNLAKYMERVAKRPAAVAIRSRAKMAKL